MYIITYIYIYTHIDIKSATPLFFSRNFQYKQDQHMQSLVPTKTGWRPQPISPNTSLAGTDLGAGAIAAAGEWGSLKGVDPEILLAFVEKFRYSCWWVEGVNGWNWIYIDPDRIFRSRYIGIGSRYIEINFLSVWSLLHFFFRLYPFLGFQWTPEVWYLPILNSSMTGWCYLVSAIPAGIWKCIYTRCILLIIVY